MTGIEIDVRTAVGAFALDARFRVPAHGVTAIFGPSGAGKTTLLRSIAGLDRPSHGIVRIGGHCWQDSSTGRFVPTHRRPLGYVFQQAALFPHLTVRGNLDYGRRRGGDRPRADSPIVEWLGLGPLLDRPVHGLSGGERRRAAMGRALVRSPRLLLMDEPLSGLDDRARTEILPYLDTLHRELDVPVLYVSHSRVEVMRLAHRVVQLERGTVRATGSVAEILSRDDPWLDAPSEIGTVVEARVAEHDERYGLTRLTIGDTALLVPGGENLRPGQRTRVRLLARDLSLTLVEPRETSILNVLPGTVVDVRDADRALCIVDVDVSGTRLLARLTRRSVETLGIRRQLPVYVQVKSAALMD